jgi:hypothetical protein
MAIALFITFAFIYFANKHLLIAIYLHLIFMPKNKSFDDRKKILNEIFRSPRTYTLEELIVRVTDKLCQSIIKKTIQNDICAIKQKTDEKGAALICSSQHIHLVNLC